MIPYSITALGRFEHFFLFFSSINFLINSLFINPVISHFVKELVGLVGVVLETQCATKH